MTIEISKDKRTEVIASIQKYFEKNMEDKIGNITASALLDFMIDELVSRHASNVGYNRLSLTRAFSVVNCQLTLA